MGSEKMSKAEVACWAGGGMWIGGVCVPIPVVKSAKGVNLVRGYPCTHTERTIRDRLPVAVRKARVQAMKPR